MFITYRNIANSCPLALWYGDEAYRPPHPLGRWYPLFPRKTMRHAALDEKEIPF